MDKLVKIQRKYSEILTSYKNKYSFDDTIKNNFKEFNELFKQTLKKAVNGANVTIEKRDEFDILSGILSQISGEFNKLESHTLEEKYKKLFLHRDQLVQVLHEHNFKFPPIIDPLIITPDYGL